MKNYVARCLQDCNRGEDLPFLELGVLAGIAAGWVLVVAAWAPRGRPRRLREAGPGDADGLVDGRRQGPAELPRGGRVLVHVRLQLPHHGEHLGQLRGQRVPLTAHVHALHFSC